MRKRPLSDQAALQQRKVQSAKESTELIHKLQRYSLYNSQFKTTIIDLEFRT